MGPPEHQGSADPDPRYVQVDHVLGRAAGARRRLRHHRSEHAGRGSGRARATGRAVQARTAGEPGRAGQATGLAMTRKSVGGPGEAAQTTKARLRRAFVVAGAAWPRRRGCTSWFTPCRWG